MRFENLISVICATVAFIQSASTYAQSIQLNHGKWKHSEHRRTISAPSNRNVGTNEEDVIVDIPGLGEIQGGSNYSFSLVPLPRKFYFFAGIPYANPASYTGTNRFKPSSVWPDNEKLSDTGAFQATDYTIKCPQSGGYKSEPNDFAEFRIASKHEIPNGQSTLAEGSQEDCLVLNIHTPTITPDPPNLLPVIVFIGGNFHNEWSGLYKGHRFLRNDVVFISVNYRLGLLGSFNLGIDDAPGCGAVYDVITALKWIKQYVSHFKGDKNRVIVAGHSAGAVLATHLLTSNLTIDENDNEPLLHGIIGLSGSSLSESLAFNKDPLKQHLRVAELAGCSDENNDPQKIRDCMTDPSKSPDDIVEAMNKYMTEEINKGRFGLDALVPSLQDESKLKAVPPVITEVPYNILKDAKQKLDVPIMMGTARHDGSQLVEQSLEKYWRPNNFVHDPLFLRNQMLPTFVAALDLEDNSREMIHSLEKIYIGDAIYTDDFESKIPGLIDIYSVLAFKAGAYNLVELNSKKNPSYYFSFERSGFCNLDIGSAVPGGVGHLSPLFYLFPTSLCSMVLPTDLEVANKFVDFWTNFATYGNPNGNGKSRTAAPYNPYNHAYLIIDWMVRTGYYCRDGWVNNSIELVKTPTEPTTETSDAPTTEASDSSSTSGDSSDSTTQSESSNPTTETSKASNMFSEKFVLFIVSVLTLRNLS